MALYSTKSRALTELRLSEVLKSPYIVYQKYIVALGLSESKLLQTLRVLKVLKSPYIVALGLRV